MSNSSEIYFVSYSWKYLYKHVSVLVSSTVVLKDEERVKYKLVNILA